MATTSSLAWYVPRKSRPEIPCFSRWLPDRFGIDFGCPNGSQIEARRRSRHAFRCISVSDREKVGSCKLSSCLINIAKMQSDCKKRGVFKDFDFVALVAFACHHSSRRLQKPLKIGVQDVPKPVQNALRYRLRVGSASITALERFWTPKYPPRRGP